MAPATPGARARRPVTVLVAALLALGATGAVAGAALGAVGAASDRPYPAHHHPVDDDRRVPRVAR